MIKFKLENRGLEKLVADLKAMQKDLLNEANEVVKEVARTTPTQYETSIDELVYEQYDPLVYQRTLHLRGAHGAIKQDLSLLRENKSYTFEIDEDSRDPIDGETWAQKAYNVEHGAEEMFAVGFNRPFIKPTQDKLEWQAGRQQERLVKKSIEIIRRFGK